MKGTFGGWRMVAHYNTGMDSSKHIMVYNGQYRGYKLYAKTGVEAVITIVETGETFNGEDMCFKRIDELIAEREG